MTIDIKAMAAKISMSVMPERRRREGRGKGSLRGRCAVARVRRSAFLELQGAAD
jgi:hypothetical protein